MGSEQQNTSELEALSGLNDSIDSMANTVSTCGTDCDTRTANQENPASPSNANRVVSVVNDVSKKPAILVCSEYQASSVNVLDTADTSSMAPSEALATPVDKSSTLTETAQHTTAEMGSLVERDSSIKALMEGFAEEEGKVAQEGEATVAPHTNQEAKCVGVVEHVESVKLEDKSGFYQSSKAAESSEKKKGWF